MTDTKFTKDTKDLDNIPNFVLRAFFVVKMIETRQ